MAELASGVQFPFPYRAGGEAAAANQMARNPAREPPASEPGQPNLDMVTALASRPQDTPTAAAKDCSYERINDPQTTAAAIVLDQLLVIASVPPRGYLLRTMSNVKTVS